VAGYLIGLWNAVMAFNEKGFYLAVFILAMYAAVSLQKTVRDKAEDLPVTGIYMGVSWAAFMISVVMLAVGLFNAELVLSEKGYYAMAFALSLYAVISVQKNIRDMTSVDGDIDPGVFPRAFRRTEKDGDSKISE
jgi:uncharacterized membrane protein YiaA